MVGAIIPLLALGNALFRAPAESHTLTCRKQT